MHTLEIILGIFLNQTFSKTQEQKESLWPGTQDFIPDVFLVPVKTPGSHCVRITWLLTKAGVSLWLCLRFPVTSEVYFLWNRIPESTVLAIIICDLSAPSHKRWLLSKLLFPSLRLVSFKCFCFWGCSCLFYISLSSSCLSSLSLVTLWSNFGAC